MSQTNIINRIGTTLKSFSGIANVMLFGSQARGDARADSDIDLLVLVDSDKVPYEYETAICSPLYDIELETGVQINPIIIPKKEWGAMVTPFYENVMREGIML